MIGPLSAGPLRALVLLFAVLLLGQCRRRGDVGAALPLGEVPAARGKVISLLYVSNARGEYEPCGCPVHPLGGLARMGTVTDVARSEADAVVQVDAGDLVTAPPIHGSDLRPPDAGERERRARLLLAGAARRGLTAFAPGETDLGIGPGRLVNLLREFKVPTVSANLVDGTGRLLFDADRLVEAAGIKIGIFGVLASPVADGEPWKSWDVTLTDPAQAAAREVKSLRARGAQIVIALLHMPGGPSAARKLLAAAPGIDWAVLGHDGSILETPEDAGEARMVEAFQMGKNLGRLDLHVVGGSLRFVDRGQRAQVATIVADHGRQLSDVRTRAAENSAASMKEYFDRQTKVLEDAIRRETQLLESLPDKVTGSWFENRIFPLDAAVPDQPGLAMLVSQYNQESQRRAVRGLPVGIAYTAAGATASPVAAAQSPLTYAGTQACGTCHAAALKFWQGTKHAHAMEPLRAKSRDGDPACVGCHSTGYLQAGGTPDIKLAQTRYANVGCESCHGPGLEHITAVDKKTSTRRAVGAVTCLGCHTPDQTNNGFDFTLFRRAVVGPGHGG